MGYLQKEVLFWEVYGSIIIPDKPVFWEILESINTLHACVLRCHAGDRG